MVYAEKALEAYEAVGDDEGVAAAKTNIAFVKSMFVDGNNEELLKAHQEMCELPVVEFGKGDALTIHEGRIYAIELQSANRRGGGKGTFENLLATSKQVHGYHHTTTKDVASALKWVITKLHFSNQH